MRKRIYLDYAAATPLDKQVATKMHKAEQFYANASAQYTSARESKEQLELARKAIAMQFGANKDEIVFTSGSTESNNLALLGLLPVLRGKEVISLATEHPSVREPLHYLERQGVTVRWCPVSSTGKVQLKAFEQLLSSKTALVTMSYVNSEIGTVQNITKLTQLTHQYAKTYNTHILFHTDASAAFVSHNCDVARLGLDMMTISSSKNYGPRSIAALYVKRGIELQPLIYGGKQEKSLRAGGQSVVLSVGFAEALKITAERRKADNDKYKQLYTQLIYQLSEHLDIKENGDAKDRNYAIANISFDGFNGEDLVAYLDREGIEVATGAACEANNDEPSQVLLAIGCNRSQAQGSLRISFGRSTTHKDIRFLVTKLSAIINRQ